MRGVSDEVWDFVKKHIDSVEQLEILLLLYRDPSLEWELSRITQEIRTSATSAGNRLSALVAGGLVATGRHGERVTYRYAPVTEALHGGVVELEQQYRIRRVRIIDVIYAPATEKMLNFMDAFKIRKSDKDE